MTHSNLFNPTLCLEIDRPQQEQIWQHSQTFANSASRWNAYLNDLCLHTLLPWLREDYDRHAVPCPNSVALASIWEFVNGAAVVMNGMRLILIPSEAIDSDELRVPQEWVDLPNWVGDYYVSVQLDLDEAWVRLNGFVSHRQLKQQAVYDWHDRTYSLDETDLIPDLNALWVARELNPTEATRGEIQNLASLPLTQAQNLISRLSDPAIVQPRLEIPFEQWGALLSHGGWRQQLMERRRGLPEQRSIWQWLQSGISNLAQQAGWESIEFQPSMAAARGEVALPPLALVRSLTIHQQSYELLISCMDESNNIWRFELRPLSLGGQIPAGYTLRLLTEDLQPFEGHEDTATTPVEHLYLEIALESGEGIVWEIDPMPELYDREILRF